MSKFIYFTLLFLSLAMSNVASAGSVFDKNCKSCHAGGGNIMNADKTLSMDHLKKNGYDSKGAIKKLVSKGKAPMPGFASSLDDKQIDAVSGYVFDQAKKGW